MDKRDNRRGKFQFIALFRNSGKTKKYVSNEQVKIGRQECSLKSISSKKEPERKIESWFLERSGYSQPIKQYDVLVQDVQYADCDEE